MAMIPAKPHTRKKCDAQRFEHKAVVYLETTAKPAVNELHLGSGL